MSTQFAITCPHCAATLKLKDDRFVGKKVPCPKCKQPFVVEHPPVDEYATEQDEYGEAQAEDSEQDEDFDAPRARGKSKSSAKPAKGKKKKSKSGGIPPVALIGGGAVLGLGLLGGIVYAVMSLFSGGGSVPNSWVKWLPEETDIAIKIRVADSLNAPIFKPITDHPTLSKLLNRPPVPGNGGANPAAAFFESLGVQAKDVDTVTIGVTDGLATAEAQKLGQNRSPQQFVAVIRLKAPLDVAKLDNAPPTMLAKEDYQGKPLYAVVGSANPKVMAYSVDSTTYLLGSDTLLKAAIDGNGNAPAAGRYAFVDDSASVVFAAAPKTPEKLSTLGLETVKSLTSGSADQGSGLHGLSYTVNLGQDMVFNTRVSLDEGKAQAASDQLKKDMATAHEQFKAVRSQQGSGNPFMPQAMQDKLAGHIDAMFGSAQANASGPQANVSMTLSGKIVTDALDMAAPFMPMLEQMAKQQSQMGDRGIDDEQMPKLGDKASDVFSYPAQVIKTGDKAKKKINDLAAQHNSAIEAEMQEGKPAADAAPAEATEEPAAATDKSGSDDKPTGDEPAAMKEPAGEDASAEATSEEEEAIPENDDDIPEGLAGALMRMERQKAREAAAAKKAGKSSKKSKGDEDEDAPAADTEEMKSEPAPEVDPDGLSTPPPNTAKPGKKKKNKGDDDEEMEAPPASDSAPAEAPQPAKPKAKKRRGDDDYEPASARAVGAAPKPDSSSGDDAESPPVMKKKKGGDDEETTSKSDADSAPSEDEEVASKSDQAEGDAAEMESPEEEEEAIPENDDDIPEGLAGALMRMERQKAREAAAAKKAGKTVKKSKADDDSEENIPDHAEEMKGDPDPETDPDGLSTAPAKTVKPGKKKSKGDDDDEEEEMTEEKSSSATPQTSRSRRRTKSGKSED